MNSMSDAITGIIQKAQAGHQVEPGDFYDKEGLLVCGKCGDRRESLVQFPGDDAPRKVPSMCKCRCEAREEERKRLELEETIKRVREFSLMDDRLKAATFDNFIVKDKNAKCHKLLKSYADRFDEMYEKSQGLILYGSVGTGKTFGAACIANQLLESGTSVVMTSFVKLIDELRGFDENTELKIQRMMRVKLLIIDDLGAERDTSFALEKVYNIIDARYRSKKPLILTTNLNMVDMLNEEDVRYSRIYDRIFEMCVPIPFEGISWRKAEAAKRNDRMRAFMEGDL